MLHGSRHGLVCQLSRVAEPHAAYQASKRSLGDPEDTGLPEPERALQGFGFLFRFLFVAFLLLRRVADNRTIPAYGADPRLARLKGSAVLRFLDAATVAHAATLVTDEVPRSIGTSVAPGYATVTAEGVLPTSTPYGMPIRVA